MKKQTFSYLIFVLLLTACNGVKFKPGAVTNLSSVGIGTDEPGTIPAPGTPDPICGDPDQPPHSVWVSIGEQTFPCANKCPDGTRLQCKQMSEKELRCLEGYPQETGVSRMVGQPQPVGLCPQLPQDCGTHAHGSKWWNESGTVSRVCETCADGSPHLCKKASENEMSCSNGVEAATGLVRDGNFISYENECLPPKPKDCADHSHGSFWWEEVDKEREACQTCWDGSKLECEYAVEGQKLCQDGATQNAGFSRRGRLLQTIGKCPVQPKDCGNVAHGATEWRVNGQGQPYNCEVCIDGSNRQCVKAKEEQVRCDDGALQLTGQTRDGDFLGYLNNCPIDIVERTESITVSAAGGKADVLFILDTTPSMFLSLNNLGTKFENLISSWTNIDWQIAVTNAKVEKTVFDPYVLEGKFMDLQKNDMTKPVERILKKGRYLADEWFYRTMSRDPSDNGCESQPYCMTNPPEPMRALKAAIDKRDSVTNKGFFREKSKLVVVMISDADEREKGSEDKKATKPEDAIKHFNDVLGSKMDGMIALSVVIKPGDAKCLARHQNIFDLGSGGRYGTTLTEFASMTGGLTASVCDSDYGPALSKLSESVRQQVESITLKDVPYNNSLQVTFVPQMSVSWVLQGKKIIFDRPIPKGTRIDVRYLVKTQ